MKVKTWSYSRLSDYERCPLFFYFKHIAKMEEPPNQWAAWGTEVHKQAEGYVSGQIKRLPASLKHVKPEIEQLRNAGAETEQTWWIDKHWQEVAAGDWDNAWLLIRADFTDIPDDGRVRVTDLKTGKLRETEHKDQLRLYATAALSLYEDADSAVARALYADHGVSIEREYLRIDLKRQQAYYTKRAKPLFNSSRYDPTPSEDACRWCFQAKSRGGNCQYG